MISNSHTEFPKSRTPRGSFDARLESPGQLALVAVGLWLVGALIHPFAILATLGLILLVAAGVAYLCRPKQHTMYWRGRQLDLSDQASGPAQQIYRSFFKH